MKTRFLRNYKNTHLKQNFQSKNNIENFTSNYGSVASFFVSSLELFNQDK